MENHAALELLHERVHEMAIVQNEALFTGVEKHGRSTFLAWVHSYERTAWETNTVHVQELLANNAYPKIN